jgi:Zn-dependent peptidase ImmA (M78 family)/transcriptional regulator with XRE-family HTH domain
MQVNTERLSVKPALLRWARETAGLSLEQASEKTAIPRKTLLQWEQLGGYLTPSQLERLAEKYHRPSAAFFLPDAPPTPSVGTDFRRYSTHRASPVGPSTQLALRRARWLQRTFVEISDERETNSKRFSLRARLGSEPSEIASDARRVFGVSVGQQLKWNDPGRALREWRSRFGSVGILVFQFRIATEEKVRGFSLGEGVPAIALNTTDTVTGRVFTLFHELGHILLARPGLCDPVEAPSRTARRTDAAEDARIETFCDRFSGDFLVPRVALLEQAQIIEYRRGQRDLVTVVEKCARAFGVSRLMFLRRMHDEEIVPTNLYWSLFREWTQAPPPRQVRGGFTSPPTKTLAELGPTFVTRVLGALDKGAITYSDVANYLSLRLKHIDHLRELLPGEAPA